MVLSNACLFSNYNNSLLDTCSILLQIFGDLYSGHCCSGWCVPCRLWSDQHTSQESEPPSTLSLSQSDTSWFFSTLQNCWRLTYTFINRSRRVIMPGAILQHWEIGAYMLSWLPYWPVLWHILQDSSDGSSRVDHQLPIAEANFTTYFCTGFPSFHVVLLYHAPLL